MEIQLSSGAMERNIWSNSWQINLHWMDQYTELLKTTICRRTGWLFTATPFKKLFFFQQDIYIRCLPAKINSIKKETKDTIHDIRSISSHLFSFMTSVVEFMIFETTERSTLKLQNTRLLRNITAEHHKPTHHHRWLLLVAGIPVGADWLEPLERARAFLKGLRILGLSPRFSSRGCRSWFGFVWLGGGFVVGAMCGGVPACSLSFSVCVLCVCVVVVSLSCCCGVCNVLRVVGWCVVVCMRLRGVWFPWYVCLCVWSKQPCLW